MGKDGKRKSDSQRSLSQRSAKHKEGLIFAREREKSKRTPQDQPKHWITGL